MRFGLLLWALPPFPDPGRWVPPFLVELGNGKNFIFDMGPGAIANYLSAGTPFNQINDIFITHLHWDHVASVPYAYMFGGDADLAQGQL